MVFISPREGKRAGEGEWERIHVANLCLFSSWPQADASASSNWHLAAVVKNKTIDRAQHTDKHYNISPFLFPPTPPNNRISYARPVAKVQGCESEDLGSNSGFTTNLLCNFIQVTWHLFHLLPIACLHCKLFIAGTVSHYLVMQCQYNGALILSGGLTVI